MGFSAQLVDGGYYENSGVYTAMNLVDLLRYASSTPHPPRVGGSSTQNAGCGINNDFAMSLSATETITACFKLITIRGKRAAPREDHAGDLLSIFPAMYEARIAKGYANLALSYTLYCGAGVNCGRGTVAEDPHIYVKYLDIQGMKLPLGWYLSDETLGRMFTSFQSPIDCLSGKNAKQGYQRVELNVAEKEENACLLPRVVRDLTMG
jgi:hypothetical protein